MGQIRKRGAFYQIRYYRNGRRIEETTDKTRYDEARGLLREREGEISKGTPITAKSMRLTFDDAVKDVENDYAINGKKSKDTVERRARLHLTPVFGGRTLASITTADVRAFAAERLEAGAAPAEINRELAIFDALSGWRAKPIGITAESRRSAAAGAQRADWVCR